MPGVLAALGNFFVSTVKLTWFFYTSQLSLVAPNTCLFCNALITLSPPCPQLVVLHPCTCPSESLDMFTSLWLKRASQVGIGLHLVISIFGSLARHYEDYFTFRCQHYEFVMHVFLNTFSHIYAISKHCYLFHCLLMPCPSLLHLKIQRSFFLPHDFKALMHKLNTKVFYSPVNCLQMVASNCFCLSWQCMRDSLCAAAWRFQLGC